ncbi:unnamed protein product, partial [Cylicocyclus nassatus]
NLKSRGIPTRTRSRTFSLEISLKPEFLKNSKKCIVVYFLFSNCTNVFILYRLPKTFLSNLRITGQVFSNGLLS